MRGKFPSVGDIFLQRQHFVFAVQTYARIDGDFFPPPPEPYVNMEANVWALDYATCQIWLSSTMASFAMDIGSTPKDIQPQSVLAQAVSSKYKKFWTRSSSHKGLADIVPFLLTYNL